MRSPGEIDDVLERRQGRPADKALLLAAMLKAVDLDPRLVWAADRSEGHIDTEVANPWWFDRVLVAIEIDHEQIFLDPSDRDLGFGHLDPDYEGASALVVDRSKPELITLPVKAFDRNGRSAAIELAVDAEGRTTGAGTLQLTGHDAWIYLGWRAGDRPSSEAWKEWLGDRFPGLEIAGVEVDEAVDDERVKVSWTLAERAEQVLGDEVTLAPSRPLGPLKQVFTLPPEKRRTPVQLPFADRDEVELTVTWPAGWEVESLPLAATFENAAGTLVASAEVEAEAHRLHYRRRLDVVRAEFTTATDYRAIRALYAEAERHDAQNLVLVHR